MNNPQVIIVVEGGMVQMVGTDIPIDITLIDVDNIKDGVDVLQDFPDAPNFNEYNFEDYNEELKRIEENWL